MSIVKLLAPGLSVKGTSPELHKTLQGWPVNACIAEMFAGPDITRVIVYEPSGAEVVPETFDP
jgi:hypothetical protein